VSVVEGGGGKREEEERTDVLRRDGSDEGKEMERWGGVMGVVRGKRIGRWCGGGGC